MARHLAAADRGRIAGKSLRVPDYSDEFETLSRHQLSDAAINKVRNNAYQDLRHEAFYCAFRILKVNQRIIAAIV